MGVAPSLVGGLGLAAALSWSPLVRAGELSLTYESKPMCPTQAAVRGAIMTLAVAEPVDDVEVVARVTAAGTGYHLSLTTFARDSEETLEIDGDDCRVLADVVALMTAIAIDPVSTARGSWTTNWSLENAAGVGDVVQPVVPEPPEELLVPPQPPGGDPGPGAEVLDELDPLDDAVDALEPPPVDIAGYIDTGRGSVDLDPGPTPLPPLDLRWAIRAGGGVDIGGLALVTGMAGGAVGLGVGRGRIEVHGRWLSPVQERYGPPPQLGISVQVWAAGLGGCYEPTIGDRVRIPLCVRAEVGQALARSIEFSASTGNSLWVAAVASPGVSVSIVDSLALVASLDVIGILRRPAFHLEGLGQPLLRAGPASFRPFLGLEVRFPGRNWSDPATKR